MDNERENEDETRDELKFENEFKKLKLQAEHGARFVEGKSKFKLPPEIEAEFLDHVDAFEKEFQKNDVRSLKEMLEYPDFPEVESLSDDEIEIEYERLSDFLADKNILVSSVYEVPFREMYRYITEEIFEEEGIMIGLPGMTTNFTYEESHPNHPEDMMKAMAQMVDHVFKRRFKYVIHNLATGFIFRGRKLDHGDIAKTVEDHLDLLPEMELTDMKDFEVALNDETSTATKATGSCHFTYKLKSSEKEISTKAKFKFKRNNDYFPITSFVIKDFGIE